MSSIKIGMIGLDTSHCAAFAKLLSDETNPYYIRGGHIHIAYPGGSDDFELSRSRLKEITNILKREYHVNIVDSIKEVAEAADAIMITSVDGRVHLQQFEEVVSYQKPVFIDKPLAVSSEHANKIFALANRHGTPVMSASALRYAEPLRVKLEELQGSNIFAADCFGPMNIEPTQGGLYWYGIHTVEMLYSILGKGCKQVTSFTHHDHEFVVAEWMDGRIGTVRGNRLKNKGFGATLHTPDGTHFIDFRKSEKPLYAGLLEDAMEMFESGITPLDELESIEIIRFIEASNESRISGKKVVL